MKPVRIAAVATLVILPLMASAQNAEMPGGSWELRYKMEIPDMPPEMAARMGERVINVCVRPGERKWHEQRNANEKGERRCEQTDLKVEGNKVAWKMKCVDGTTGEGVLTHNGKDSYSQTLNMSGPRGSVKTLTEGKRVAETCEQK